VAHFQEVQVVVTTEEVLEDYFLRTPGLRFYRLADDKASVCHWRMGDEGVELVEKPIGSESQGTSDNSDATQHKTEPPLRYYGWVRKNQRNGDITVPIWPDCRAPSGAEQLQIEAQLKQSGDTMNENRPHRK
jgi:hypothetical protein